MKLNINNTEIKARLISRWVGHWKGETEKIWIYRIEVERDGKRARFTWHDSIFNYNRGHNSFNRGRVESALSSLFLDLTTAINEGSVEDLINEFGYEWRDAERLNSALSKMYDDFSALFTDEEIFNIANEFSAMGY